MGSANTFNQSLIPNNLGQEIVDIAGRTGVSPTELSAIMEASNAWNLTPEQMQRIGDTSAAYGVLVNELEW